MRRWLITITAVLLQGFTVTHPVQAQQTLLAAALVGALTLTPTLFAQDAPTTGDKPAESKPKDEPRNLDAPAKRAQTSSSTARSSGSIFSCS